MKSESRKSEASRRWSVFPKSLSRPLEDIVKPISRKHGFAEHRILSEWESIIGSELASCCLPRKLTFPRGRQEGGTLHVLVAGARALELQHMQPIILDRINTYFGHPAVGKLAFLQSSAAMLKREKKKPATAKSAPDASLRALVEGCEDDALKEALLSLGCAIAVKKT